MMRRFLLVVAMLSFAIPGGAHASSNTVAPPYKSGPQGGDTYNLVNADPTTGQMAVVRYYPIPTSTGLGCGGNAGFANFAVDYDAGQTAISKIDVAYDNAVIDPYTWINVAVRSGDNFVRVTPAPLRGPVAGSGVDELTLDPPTSGPLTVWFGLQVAAACPNFDGGEATFSSLTFK